MWEPRGNADTAEDRLSIDPGIGSLLLRLSSPFSFSALSHCLCPTNSLPPDLNLSLFSNLYAISNLTSYMKFSATPSFIISYIFCLLASSVTSSPLAVCIWQQSSLSLSSCGCVFWCHISVYYPCLPKITHSSSASLLFPSLLFRLSSWITSLSFLLFHPFRNYAW